MYTLVVGQGIAGSLVAFMLHLHKMPFIVIDPGQMNTSSRIAAGMFTPVSGKRYTVSPHVLQQISFAKEVYSEIEQLIGCAILHLRNIYHVHSYRDEEKDLVGKLANADVARFIINQPMLIEGIKQGAGAFEITNSGWVDCELFIDSFALWLKRNDALIEERFVYNDLQITGGEMEYHGSHFSNIIFCEAFQHSGIRSLEFT